MARGDNAPQQNLDQAQNDVASARADVAEAEANYAAAQAGPTREQRAVADAQVEAASSAVRVLERRLEKTALRAPSDGVVSVIMCAFSTAGSQRSSRRSEDTIEMRKRMYDNPGGDAG